MRVDYAKYANKVKFWKSVVESAKDFIGTSPPSIFVGKALYPKVFMGILSPTQQQDSAEILDSPERWYERKATISDILGYRGRMIYSRFRSSVTNPTGRLVEVAQEISMADRPADVEINLEGKPMFSFNFDRFSMPVANPATVKSASLVSNTHVDNKVDYIVSDTDARSADAVSELYKSGVPVSNIQKIFTSGLLGSSIERRIVPTRWGITAVDDIIGKRLRSKIADYDEISEVRLFHDEYLGNRYNILIIPGVYRYELVEIWHENGSVGMSSDFEDHYGIKGYADNTHGAFYSGRLAVLEYLERIGRQASVLIVREILPSYDVPMGIWQMRESVRGAMRGEFEKFDDLGAGLNKISESLLYRGNWKASSKLIKALRQQTTIRNFVKSIATS